MSRRSGLDEGSPELLLGWTSRVVPVQFSLRIGRVEWFDTRVGALSLKTTRLALKLVHLIIFLSS
jgi:hypothetical protein